MKKVLFLLDYITILSKRKKGSTIFRMILFIICVAFYLVCLFSILCRLVKLMGMAVFEELNTTISTNSFIPMTPE